MGGSIVVEQITIAQSWLLKVVARLCPPSIHRREEGQDMIEYALLAALISIVAIAIILLIGPYLDNLFEDVVNALGTT
jgi:Flp pilus assembly pilin Flp